MKRALLALVAGLLLAGQDPSSGHPFEHRILWTWDSWICDFDPNGSSYLAEYKDLIDWMAKNDYTGLVVWGFIDGRHGGEAAAKELARYARTKDIRLLAGISTDIGPYGPCGGFAQGIPDHPYNDEVQARAMAPTKRPGEVNLCYSRPENRDWLRKGTEWLLKTFAVDGVSVETTEGGLRCRCAECQGRLKSQGGPTGAASYGDLSLCMTIVADVFRKNRPGGLITYAAHRPLWWEQTTEAIDMLKATPESCTAQWNLELTPCGETESPVKRNLALVHTGGYSYHLRKPRPSTRAFSQYRCFNPRLEDIRTFCRNLGTTTFNGFVVGSAGSHKNPDAELAYLGFIDFSEDPKLTADAFLARHLPRLYGAAAADEVGQVFTRQPAIHEQGLPFWNRYAGDWEARSEEKARNAAAGFAAQIALARSAAAKATADGKRRLDAIIAVLDEYRIICEAAAAGPYKASEEGRRRLARFYEKAGLPDDIYRYKEWKP